MYKVMREDGIFGGTRCLGVYETKEEAQLHADRLQAADRVGEWLYYVEEAEEDAWHV